MKANTLSIAKFPEVDISKCTKMNSGCLVFRFKGKFTEEAADSAVSAWEKFQNQNPTATLVHIWNCTEMTGFEVQSKNIWMNQMKKSSDQIKQIMIISDNIVIRGAARLMSKFSKHALHVYKTEEEMERSAFQSILA